MKWPRGRPPSVVPQHEKPEPLPAFVARRRDRLLVIDCPHCKTEHAHEFPGGRVVAGCADPTSPYAERGYIVRVRP